MEEQMNRLTAFLKEMAGGDGEMASIIVNNDGVIRLRIGLSHEETLTPEELAKAVEYRVPTTVST